MSREHWYADTWEITQGIVRDVETREGLYKSAPTRGSNAEIAGRHGQAWRSKKLDPLTFTLNIWLGDTATRAQTEAYYDDLLRAVRPLHRQVRYKRHLAGGEIRECYGEVLTAVEPQPLGQLGIRCGLEITAAAGLWKESASPHTDQTTASSTLPKTLPLTGFAASTGPMADLAYVITGPIANPQVVDVTDGVDGASFTWTGTIGAGQTLTVDAAGWSVTGGAGLVVTSSAALYYTGDCFLEVPPAPPGGTPTVQLRGANGGSTTRLAVSGTRSYAA